jgi:TM2 domain-containing membrane protein YozV
MSYQHATVNQSYAALALATPANATSVEATMATTSLSKKALKKQAKKAARVERKMARKAKFTAFIAKFATDSNQVLAVVLVFFLGGLGIHRVYLGAKPIIILWYVLSFGGFFGLMPFIDFLRLIFGGTAHYEGNDNFWATFKS